MSKKLVAYFSASGTTAAVAKTLSEAAEADLYEITPQTPYTRADLDWMNKKSRSSVEMNDKSFRPPLADKDAHVENYDTIFLGFPIWWYVAPTIINTFLESLDTGKPCTEDSGRMRAVCTRCLPAPIYMPLPGPEEISLLPGKGILRPFYRSRELIQ